MYVCMPCVCVFIFLFFSYCVRRFVFCFCRLSLCCCCWNDEHSFVILLRATDWLNVYLFVVRVVSVVVVVVAAARRANMCVVQYMNLF